MVRIPFALRLPPLALLLACQQSASPAAPAGLSGADRAALDSLHGVFATAAMAGDFAAVATMYTEDGKLLGPNMPMAVGRIGIKEAFGLFPPIGDFKIISQEVHGTADMAAVRGTYSLLFAPPGQLAVPDTGKFVELWSKQADGKWLLVWDMFSSDKPTPTTH